MKIKYIKDAPNGPAGMTDEVSDFHANILVLTGFAEIYDGYEPILPVEPKPKAKPKPKTTKVDTATDTDDGTKTESGSLTNEGTKTETDSE